MKAVVFEGSIPRALVTMAMKKIIPHYIGPMSMIRLAEVPEPKLLNENWVKIKTRYGGICASDLATAFFDISPSIEPYASKSFILGHENIGTITEVGSAVKGFSVGQRIVADLLLPCPTRDLPEWCRHCKKEEWSRCQNYRIGTPGEGLMLGNNMKVGGSWSPYFLAHPFQLFPVPDNVSDENALMVEPFSVALHAVMRTVPSDDQTVLVIGIGIQGLSVIAALRALGFKGRILAVAKYPFQAEMAKNFGADEIIDPREDFEAVARHVGGSSFRLTGGKHVMIGGGADIVYECVGSDSALDDALRLVGPGGKVILISLIDITKNTDWGPLVSKEVKVYGSFASGTEDYAGERKRCFQIILDWMQEGKLDLSPLLTHRFKLKDYQKALSSNTRKGKNRMLRSVFEFD